MVARSSFLWLVGTVANLFTVVSPVVAQTTKAPVTHEALWLMPRVGAPNVSPDGTSIVFSVTQPAYDKENQTADLWIVPADGGAPPRQLTWTKASEGDVAWSPDSSRIAFTTQRDKDEADQVYVLDLVAGGEAQRVTSLSTGASSPKWRPDGGALLFASRVFPGTTDDAENQKEAARRKDLKYNVRTFDTFPIRLWDQWLDDRQTHVFVQSLDGGAAAVDLFAGTELVRGSGFRGRLTNDGEKLDAAWAPDGQSIVFVATTEQDRAAYATVHTQLFEVSARGGEPRQLTNGPRSFAGPVFQRDGRALFFSVADDDDQIYAPDRLAVSSWPWAGALRVLTEGFDRSVETIAPTPDGRSVYVTAEDEGLVKLYVVATRSGETSLAAPSTRGAYTNLGIAQGARPPVIVANWASSVDPAEIVRIDPAARQHRALTAFSTERAARLDWRPPEHFTFTSSRGKAIHNLLVLPQAFDAQRKYPLFVVIHGGPHGMWSDQITLRWNYHLLAAPGYVVLLTNFTGSTGFGEKFARDIRRDPFEGPAGEINEAADEAIRRYAFIDGSRQIAAGASYGGHLINWLQATTTRYRALVGHAGLVNSESQWGTSDHIYRRELMADGPPWLQTDTWIKQNPIRRAANFKTPILLSVGERDFRVPINNTLENWSALQRQRVPSRLLVWPDENHWVSNAENSRHFYAEVHAWLARWLEGSASGEASVSDASR
jgi:dipeptidyl aminopeptidase/acylaminoacyl peptidase